jgi:hypothetical protein
VAPLYVAGAVLGLASGLGSGLVTQQQIKSHKTRKEKKDEQRYLLLKRAGLPCAFVTKTKRPGWTRRTRKEPCVVIV